MRETSDQHMVETRSEKEPLDEQQSVSNTGEQMQAVFSEAHPVYTMPMSLEQLQPDAQESSEAGNVWNNVTENTQDEMNHIEAPPPPGSQTEIPV